jgi:enoyl-CoA hydratase/carnithine racemase
VGTETETRAYIERIQDVTRALCLNRKMVIGAIHGWAVGGGLEWVINCDFVIMSRDARFFFPEISLGIFVTGAVTRLLTQQIGLQKARRLILLGEQYSANDAPELGFDWQVVDPDAVDDEARALAQRIAALPPGPVGDLKQALREGADTDLEGAMAIETQATLKGFLDPDSAQRARDRLG